MEEKKKAIHSWVMFTFNYPAEWYEKVEWNNVSWQHIASKWFLNDFDFNRLYCELDRTNRERLLDYVIKCNIKEQSKNKENGKDKRICKAMD